MWQPHHRKRNREREIERENREREREGGRARERGREGGREGEREGGRAGEKGRESGRERERKGGHGREGGEIFLLLPLKRAYARMQERRKEDGEERGIAREGEKRERTWKRGRERGRPGVGFDYHHPVRHPVSVSPDTVILLPTPSTRYCHLVLDDGYWITVEF